MTIKNDIPFTCFLPAFLQFDNGQTILNGSLMSEFCGSECILMNLFNSVVQLKIQFMLMVCLVIGLDRMLSTVSKKKTMT